MLDQLDYLEVPMNVLLPSHPRCHRSALLAGLVLLLTTGGSLLAQDGPAAIQISPALPTSSDTVHLVVEATCFNVSAAPTISGNTITLQVGPPPPLVPIGVCVPRDFPLGPLAAGSYTVRQVNLSGGLLGTSVFQVVAPSTGLNLFGGQFQATASWSETTSGVSQDASAVAVSDKSGYFWFFDPASTEVSVKILDGTAINGHYWVFIASSTTVPYYLTITQADYACNSLTSPCTQAYNSTSGTNQNFVDLNTFAPLKPN
jgi:hypothetical protein